MKAIAWRVRCIKTFDQTSDSHGATGFTHAVWPAYNHGVLRFGPSAWMRCMAPLITSSLWVRDSHAFWLTLTLWQQILHFHPVAAHAQYLNTRGSEVHRNEAVRKHAEATLLIAWPPCITTKTQHFLPECLAMHMHMVMMFQKCMVISEQTLRKVFGCHKTVGCMRQVLNQQILKKGIQVLKTGIQWEKSS